MVVSRSNTSLRREYQWTVWSVVHVCEGRRQSQAVV